MSIPKQMGFSLFVKFLTDEMKGVIPGGFTAFCFCCFK